MENTADKSYDLITW